MLEEFINGLVATIGALGYPGLFLLMAMESSILPVPSELVMPPAGYLVQQGKMDLSWAILSGTFGSLCGAYANYAAAQWLGRPFLVRYGRFVLITEHHLRRVEDYFNDHGEISTFVGRLLPVVRHLISLPAGLAKMNHGRFAFYTFVGSLLWVAVLTGIGYVVGANQALMQKYSHQLVWAVIILSVVIVFVYSALWRKKQRS